MECWLDKGESFEAREDVKLIVYQIERMIDGSLQRRSETVTTSHPGLALVRQDGDPRGYFYFYFYFYDLFKPAGHKPHTLGWNPASSSEEGRVSLPHP
jgi:hypothetical protein